MSKRCLLPLVLAAACHSAGGATPVDPTQATMSILTPVGADSTSSIEGLAIFNGRLFVADWKDGAIYRIDPANPAPEKVGQLPLKPGTSILGAVTDSIGDLFFAVPDPGVIYRVAVDRIGAKNFNPAKDATVFATGAKGANGINFDHNGHLWIGGGDADALYQVGPKGGVAMTFAKHFSPISTDTTMPVRGYVVNGVAVDSKGFVYTVNTGTGEIVRLTIGAGYRPGPIATFTKDARLIGADGLIVDSNDNLWVSSNFQSHLVKITQDGAITIVAGRAAADGSAPAIGNGPADALRFPAELKRAGRHIFLTNLNFPIGANAKGHIAGASIALVTLPNGI
ncbi:MAG: SMP-30/gluconolactonase/LRE family protein [Gemmatimonadales bacterium]